jgi:hypothetical protein
MYFEINTTYDCNASCKWCNRALDITSWPDSHVTPRQVKAMVAELKRYRITRVTLGGGEPLMNPQLQEIVDIVATLGPVRRGYRVLTNTLDYRGRDLITLPKGFKWVGSDARTKDHYPQWWSPADYGWEYTGQCRIIRSCGRGFDAWGFLCCGIAGILGRLLGVDPYRKTFVRDMMPDICKHCQHSLPRENIRRIHRRIKAGKLEYPTKTWWEVFNRHAKQRMECDKYGES